MRGLGGAYITATSNVAPANPVDIQKLSATPSRTLAATHSGSSDVASKTWRAHRVQTPRALTQAIPLAQHWEGGLCLSHPSVCLNAKGEGGRVFMAR